MIRRDRFQAVRVTIIWLGGPVSGPTAEKELKLSVSQMSVSSDGSLIQANDPANEKALSRKLKQVCHFVTNTGGWTLSWGWYCTRNGCQESGDIIRTTMTCAECIIKYNLYVILNFTGNQCKSWIAVEMWSRGYSCFINLAAVFSTHWSGAVVDFGRTAKTALPQSRPLVLLHVINGD